MVTRPLTENPERTHEAIVFHLKRSGEMTVAELCEALGITSMAVRRHLIGLQQEGLVDSKMVRQSRGRPTYRYFLTSKAEQAFPSGYENLTSDLLDIIHQQSGHKGVMKVLSARNEKQIKQFGTRMTDKTLGERVAEVAKIFSENGYMTEWEGLADGNYVIFQRHCALHSVADQYRQLCILEPKLIEGLLGVKVTRQQYMLKHDPVCGYMVHANQQV